MDLALNKEQVLALAPDAASAKAATGLVSDGKWELLGADADALWGECKGSGAKPYQTQVDKAAMVARCSCPSRKFPCKHGLALLLMYVQPNPRFAQPAARPEWVAQWLASRQERQARKEQSASERPAQDPVATAAAALKRKEQRWSRIESGGADLQRWISDQFRAGLARFGQEQREQWRSMSARMVDAQAPGLGQLLQLALAAVERGSEGYEEAAERLGALQLLCEGISRRRQLTASRIADLRTALGWPIDKDEMGDGEQDIVSDQWCTLGVAHHEHDERLRERRVWLRGTQSGRHALLLDFAFKGAGWETQWIAGAAYPATLRFHPGSVPLRASVVEQGNATTHEWPQIDADAAIDQASQWLGANPWLPRVPLLLESVQADIGPDGWWLRSPHGRFPLFLDTAAGWSLLAFSGGHALRLMGEWDGRKLQPLHACLQDDPEQRWTPAVIGSAA